MKKQYLKHLVKRLKKYFSKKSAQILRDNDIALIIRDDYTYIVLFKAKHLEFLKVFFIDAQTREIIKIYKSQSIFYKDIYKEIIIEYSKLIKKYEQSFWF